MSANSQDWPETILDDLPLLWQVVERWEDGESVLRDGLGFKHARDLVKFFRYAAKDGVAISMQPMGTARA